MWIQVSVGNGPAECGIAVFLFNKFIELFCKRNGIHLEVLKINFGKMNKEYRSVLLKIKTDKDKEKMLSKEFEGTQCWICKNTIRQTQKRKNWYFSVEFFQEYEEIKIDLKNINIETMKSPGAGGQHVNKTETGVRITHKSSKISVVSTEERSQYLNKKLAIARLSKKLKEKNMEKRKNIDQLLWSKHQQLIRGNPVKVFLGTSFVIK